MHLAGNPEEVFANGVRLPLSAPRAAIVAHLVKHGFASHKDLLALRPTMTPESLKVTVHHLRGLLPPDMELVNEWGRGYVLKERDLPLVPPGPAAVLA